MAQPFLSLIKVDTGFVFCRSNPSRTNSWDFITRAVAEEFECGADELDNLEDDDGVEFVTLRGEPIVQIAYGYVRNPTPVRPVFAQAAE